GQAGCHARRRAAGLHRRAGGAMRLLHQRLGDDRGAAPARQPESERHGHPQGARGTQVPLRHAHEHPSRGEARAGAAPESIGGAMDTITVTRRDFLKAGGALVVSFSWNGAALGDAQATSWPKVIPPDALDSWIAIGADGTVTASIGKVETGMGISTAFMQIVAEELDVPMERVVLRMGDTAQT